MALDRPTLAVEPCRGGWRVVLKQADGRRTFVGHRRYVTEDEARAASAEAAPRIERLWTRLGHHDAD